MSRLVPSLRRALLVSLEREMLVSFRNKGELANPLVFFLMIVVFLPLGISNEKEVLSSIAPGMIWVIALLANMLSLDGLFRSDYEDGSLEQMVLSPQPLYWIVLTKVLTHWLLTGVPLALMTPVLGIMMYLPAEGYLPMIVSLLIGTASMSIIGAIGAALTVSLKKGGLILYLVVMPLYVPVLIFGSSAVKNAVEGFAISVELSVLGALLMAALMMAPFAVAGALNISVKT